MKPPKLIPPEIGHVEGDDVEEAIEIAALLMEFGEANDFNISHTMNAMSTGSWPRST